MPILSIDEYIKKIEKDNIDGGHHRTKAYPFKCDGVILVEKYQRNFDELKKRIETCKKLGVAIPAYIDYKVTEDGKCFILEELAKGKEFEDLIEHSNNPTQMVSNIPYEHIEKYIKDSYLLYVNGVECEPRTRNIFYDSENGFTNIDVQTCNTKKNQSSLSSLVETALFFNTFSKVFNTNYIKDENGITAKEKTYSKVLKAFENAYPNFAKYKRWIYRDHEGILDFLKAKNYDFNLTQTECEEFNDFVEQLINTMIDEYISDKVDFSYNIHCSDMMLLNSSIKFYPNFSLYDTKKQTFSISAFEKYIKGEVNLRLKQLFMENRDNKALESLYYKIRINEIDPRYIYDRSELRRLVEEELNEYDVKNTLQLTTTQVGKKTISSNSVAKRTITEHFRKWEKKQEKGDEKEKPND